jgi:hypothetical protein
VQSATANHCLGGTCDFGPRVHLAGRGGPAQPQQPLQGHSETQLQRAPDGTAIAFAIGASGSPDCSAVVAHGAARPADGAAIEPDRTPAIVDANRAAVIAIDDVGPAADVFGFVRAADHTALSLIDGAAIIESVLQIVIRACDVECAADAVACIVTVVHGEANTGGLVCDAYVAAASGSIAAKFGQ